MDEPFRRRPLLRLSGLSAYPPLEELADATRYDAGKRIGPSYPVTRGWRAGTTRLGPPVHMLREHASHIDAMLTDLMMPGMSGRQLSEKVRALRPSMRVLVLPYPLEGRPDEEVRQIAADAYPRLLRTLGVPDRPAGR